MLCILERKQKHDIVHVEIWAGDGEKTIGARWQKEKYVWHIDHYSFVFDNKKEKKIVLILLVKSANPMFSFGQFS